MESVASSVWLVVLKCVWHIFIFKIEAVHSNNIGVPKKTQFEVECILQLLAIEENQTVHRNVMNNNSLTSCISLLIVNQQFSLFLLICYIFFILL